MERTEQLTGRLGIFLDRPSYLIPPGGLSAARNCRIRNGRIERRAMGWAPLFDIQLNGPVLLITEFVLRTGTRLLILGTDTDLYLMDSSSGALDFLTPTYAIGFASVNNGSDDIVGVGGTLWLANAKAGDSISFGSLAQTDPEAVWYDILSVTDNTHLKLTAPYAGATDLLVYTIRKRFTGTDQNIWSTDTFYNTDPSGDDVWFATNGVDNIVSWDGVATQVTDQAALGIRCEWLRVFQRVMFYGNVFDIASGERRPNVVRTSAIGDPLNVATLEAAEVNGTDVSDHLVNGVPLGDNIVIYGHLSTSVMQFLGYPLMWATRTVSRTLGALSARGCIDRGNFHTVPSRDGAYRFDGVQGELYANHIWGQIVTTFELARIAQLIGFIDYEACEVLWTVPLTSDTGGAPSTTYTEHYREQQKASGPVPYMVRDLPATAFGEFTRTDALRFNQVSEEFQELDVPWNSSFFSDTYPRKLFGTVDGFLFELNVADTMDGATFASFARFARIPLVDGTRRAIVREIEPYIEPVPGSTFTLAARFYDADTPEGLETLVCTVEMDMTGDPAIRWRRPRCAVRYLDLEVGTEGANQPWTVSGVRLLTRDAGRR